MALFTAAPAAAAAQDTVVITRFDRDGARPAERRALAVFNAASTMRVLGEHTIERDAVVEGDVAVLDGPLRVEGRVTGDIIAINADLEIVAGADVLGDLLVLGGRAVISDEARITGALEQHTARVPVRWVHERLEIVRRVDTVHVDRRERERERERRLPRSRVAGRASVVLTTAGTYNRVEGLPVYGGPRLSWSTLPVDVRLEGMGILRTAASLDLDNRDVGYRALARVRLGRGRPLELGARAFDQVLPIEDWQLRDGEVGWATLLLHRDYRDYFLARGGGAHARLRFGRIGSVWADAARFDVTSAAARDPWTPFRNSQPWRPNPVVDEGRFTEFRAGFEINMLQRWRSDGGFRLRAEWLHGSGDNVIPAPLPPGLRDPIPVRGYRYDRVWADVRLHQPFVGGALSLRGLAAGDLRERGPLPVHRRLSLGGPDPLPGFAFRRFACNETVGDPALPALCDRMVLFQAEYRTGFSLDVGGDEDEDDGWWSGWGDWDWDWFDWDETHVVLFSDAGAAWTGDVAPRRLNWDVGAGLEIGGVGIYFARSLEQHRPVRVVLRLHRRF
jgi:hypothetical protein